MKTLRVGFIGTGKPRFTEGSTGFGMAYEHAMGFQACPGLELAACADINPANAQAFAQHHGIKSMYLDYKKMLRDENLQVLSICTWPHLHLPMITAAIKAGVKAIHCEKPMATTWGDALKMAALAKKHRVQLTFNHQRRFGAPVQAALKLIRQGKIGEVQRMDAFVWNLFDSGPHYVDMIQMFNQEVPARWVIGQVDSRYGGKAFGAPVDNQILMHVAYENEVQALVVSARTGLGRKTHLRITGSEGVIEISGKEPLKVRLKGESKLKVTKVNWDFFDPQMTVQAVVDSMKAFRAKRPPQLSAANALKTAEIIFACYESSRRRGRVDFPLTEKDNALQDLRDKKAFKTEPWPKEYHKKWRL